MGRGNSSGGGQSQLGYLLGGGGEASTPKPTASEENNGPSPKPAVTVTATATAPATAPPPVDVTNQVPAGVNSTSLNNYMRADGQNSGNFLTDRPSTRVHAAPGGGSSLDYLFSGNK